MTTETVRPRPGTPGAVARLLADRRAPCCTHPNCRLPVDMTRSGGVRDAQGRAWHHACLRYWLVRGGR
jgi:hypothetical protein